MLASCSLALAAALLSPIFLPHRPILVWNATPSSTIGLYCVHAPATMRKGDMLVAFAPTHARELAARRGYLPYSIPLVKPIAAVSGDRICARGANVFVNGAFAARRLASDPLGRALPSWQGCTTLLPGEAFLLSQSVPQAFDGRYFGITQAKDIVGGATLLLAR